MKKSPAPLRGLLAACRPMRFEPHDIAAQLDARGHYRVALTPEFPLSIKRFRFTSRRHTPGQTWHERLELFLPLDGPTRFRMGDQNLELAAGDLLVVDNLKLHHVVDFPGFDTRVLVISFLPEFVYSLGSPSGDYTFLLPFYSKLDHHPHILHPGDAAAPAAYAALVRLLETYFGSDERPFVQAGSKAYLLELLYHLAGHFRSSEVLKWEFMRQQERSLRLKRLFDHLREHATERLSVGDASRMVAMSPAAFMKAFKQVAGMTLVTYLNHVRLARAAQLLRETSHTIAEIAAETGFADQSYFDRRFKKAFGVAPKVFRARPGKPAPPGRPGLAGSATVE
ncbi:MAG: helix-turn-helix transcriptional regulator [Verrucomicrobia bacterium]|nr:helix-turn-helix transcriptional regulator [Verrucomicrobiota bacterium]